MIKVELKTLDREEGVVTAEFVFTEVPKLQHRLSVVSKDKISRLALVRIVLCVFKLEFQGKNAQKYLIDLSSLSDLGH